MVIIIKKYRQIYKQEKNVCTSICADATDVVGELVIISHFSIFNRISINRLSPIYKQHNNAE